MQRGKSCQHCVFVCVLQVQVYAKMLMIIIFMRNQAKNCLHDLWAITLTIVHPWERCLASTRLSANVFVSLPLPFWWQEPCCSNECSLYPGSQIPPHIRCHPAARAEWCARREVSSNPPCPPSLPPPSRCQLSGPAFWVRGYRDYHRCRSTRRAFPSQGAQNACESDNR